MLNIVRRLLQAFITLVGALTVMFLILRLTPGDPVQIMLGDYRTPELEATLRARYGLDQPLPVQYVKYVGNILTGQLGVSYWRNQDVTVLVGAALPYTLQLAVAAVMVTCVIGLPLGVLAALKRNTAADLAAMFPRPACSGSSGLMPVLSRCTLGPPTALDAVVVRPLTQTTGPADAERQKEARMRRLR